MFMTAVTVTYIIFAPEGLSLLTQPLFGYAIGYTPAVAVGLCATALLLFLFGKYLRGVRNQITLSAE